MSDNSDLAKLWDLRALDDGGLSLEEKRRILLKAGVHRDLANKWWHLINSNERGKIRAAYAGSEPQPVDIQKQD